MPTFDFSKPQVSVIVVSADSGPSLGDCVRSVLTCTLPLEVLLIDNASSDGIPEAIARAHARDPRFKVNYNRANLGFGPAVNRAAAQARGEVLLILNPDCLIDQAALQRLLDVLATEPQAGLVGAVVCDAQDVPDPASLRYDPLIGRALATLFKCKDGINAREIPHRVVEAQAVSGAVMLMPRSVFELLHGFDESYFLHCEDLDLCRRVRDAGWRVLLAGDVRVLHGKGGSSRHRPVFVSYHKHRGMWRWFLKFDPYARKPSMAAAVWLGVWLHFLMGIPGQWLRMVRR